MRGGDKEMGTPDPTREGGDGADAVDGRGMNWRLVGEASSGANLVCVAWLRRVREEAVRGGGGRRKETSRRAASPA